MTIEQEWLLLKTTIEQIADMMNVHGTIEEKCAKIQQVFKTVGTMMPQMKEEVEKNMKLLQDMAAKKE